jgi:hypothetical protein
MHAVLIKYIPYNHETDVLHALLSLFPSLPGSYLSILASLWQLAMVQQSDLTPTTSTELVWWLGLSLGVPVNIIVLEDISANPWVLKNPHQAVTKYTEASVITNCTIHPSGDDKGTVTIQIRSSEL